MFDIPFGITTCQHPSGDPVSIKTAAVKAASRAASVCLADARRVWSWDQPLVLVVGLYAQKGATKLFHTIYEFHFKLDAVERNGLFGTLTLAEVTEFHETLKSYGIGQHAEARAWAKAEKRRLLPRTGAIQLNPKIDSKLQRRLQCSALLKRLVEECSNMQKFSTGEPAGYRGLPLPYVVQSSARKFSDKA